MDSRCWIVVGCTYWSFVAADGILGFVGRLLHSCYILDPIFFVRIYPTSCGLLTTNWFVEDLDLFEAVLKPRGWVVSC